MFRRIIIRVLQLLSVVMIITGFVAYLCVAECENMLITSCICIVGMFGGGIMYHISEQLSKRTRGHYYGV